MRKIVVLLVVVMLVLISAGCAAGPNDLVNDETSEREPAGFWLGLWHGFITPVTFIISLFNDNVNIYEVYNNGNWYNFGFVFGLSIIFGGSHGGRRSSRKRRDD